MTTSHPFVDDALITRGTFPSLERANTFPFRYRLSWNRRRKAFHPRPSAIDPQVTVHAGPAPGGPPRYRTVQSATAHRV